MNPNNLAQFTLKNRYQLLVLAHALLGVLIFWKPPTGAYFSVFLFFSGICYIVKNKNRNNEVLFAAAYATGSEVLVRMVDGAGYEFGKYTVLIFAMLGIAYSGFSKKSWLYALYLLLLLPSLILTDNLLSLSKPEINVIISNISGPTCLGFLSIYALGKKITLAQVSRVLLLLSMPILSIAVNVLLSSPDTKSITSVESNAYFSGMFGPNQVSTALGLGMFVFFSRAILNSESRHIAVLNLLLGSFLSYVGLLTFSRAGMITGFCAVVSVAVLVFLKSESYGKWKAKTRLAAIIACFFAMFALISFQTDGLLVKRYTNRDHLGRVKRDKPGDRRSIATQEIKMFVANPIIGVGTTKAEETRKAELGREFHSHDEITRMLAEHGTLGFIGILILLVTPAWLFFREKRNILLAPFFVFWFLTINHSGIRVAAPAFVYALMLLQVDLSSCSLFSRKTGPSTLYSKMFVRKPQVSSI